MRIVAALWAIAVVVIVVLADTGNLEWALRIVAWVPGRDKTLHAVLMGGLAASVCLALGWSGARSPARAVLVGSVGVFALVLAEELSQQLIATRSFDLVDLLADVVGILMLSTLALAWLRHRAAREAPEPARRGA